MYSFQQESCEEENLTTQLPPMPCVYNRFFTWIIQQEPFENVNSSILPGVELTLNSSCLCSNTVKLSFADTLLLSCVAQERLESQSVVCSYVGTLEPA